MHEQLGLEDIERRSAELRRLGETVEYGYELLDVLAANGWELAITSPLAGGMIDTKGDGGEAPVGILVIARRGAIEIKEMGVSVADVAGKVLKEAARLRWAARAA